MGWAEVFTRILGSDVSVEIRAFDGSQAGRSGADVRVEIRSPLALSHLAAAPGELGLARAYVSGAIEVHGDMYTALAAFPSVALNDIPPGLRRELAVKLAGYRLWWPVRPPEVEHRPRGWRHSKHRDSKSISYHYDVSNRFYEWVLGPSMAYTCAVYPTERSTLEEAQFAKHDLVARKLGLREGMRLLDVGCGWGGMVMHAAEHYGVRALGVTLSRQQAQWAQKTIAERGLADLAEVRHLDYRDVSESGFDAVSSIGLTEHIGLAQLPSYFSFLHDKLVPGGRLLNHCITRPDGRRGSRPGKFIGRYVFPDGELEPVGTLVSAMNDNGFEVRHEENLREHYALTLAGWCANLEQHWDEAVAEVGLERARVWRLYMAACQLGFERNNVQLHQVLGVRLDDTDAHVPLRPTW
ncbi:cyclopropane-fatty-acyl-phospholipid synthase family protein [Saccharopolyspora sp. K220]|uniref:SAM-dependent methyltransferase n=1 Tax=Saccharopolyspora soli TaxID=2926618 RepID=UPI001F56DA95|nr:cyclopropane-fatty-acyl-phospholipid synthase family protein [Saccharopolyspora soli]MCI2424128.1 cyclopropane-fatty-acyl-phospholipid synthase family protein [Saccharopolyspora soli]